MDPEQVQLGEREAESETDDDQSLDNMSLIFDQLKAENGKALSPAMGSSHEDERPKGVVWDVSQITSPENSLVIPKLLTQQILFESSLEISEEMSLPLTSLDSFFPCSLIEDSAFSIEKVLGEKTASILLEAEEEASNYASKLKELNADWSPEEQHSVLTCRVCQLFVRTVDRLLDKSEELMNNYLPLTEEEIENLKKAVQELDEDSSGHQMQVCLTRISNLSGKLRQRAYMMALNKLRLARRSTEESLMRLHQTINLIGQVQHSNCMDYEQSFDQLNQIRTEWAQGISISGQLCLQSVRCEDLPTSSSDEIGPRLAQSSNVENIGAPLAESSRIEEDQIPPPQNVSLEKVLTPPSEIIGTEESEILPLEEEVTPSPEDISKEVPPTPPPEVIRTEVPPTPPQEDISIEMPPTPAPEDISIEVPPTPAPEDISIEMPPTPPQEDINIETPPTPPPENISIEMPPTPPPEDISIEMPPTPAPEDISIEVPPTPPQEDISIETPPTPPPEDISIETPPTPPPEDISIEMSPTLSPETSKMELPPTLPPEPISIEPPPTPPPEDISPEVPPTPPPEDISPEVPPTPPPEDISPEVPPTPPPEDISPEVPPTPPPEVTIIEVVPSRPSEEPETTPVKEDIPRDVANIMLTNPGCDEDDITLKMAANKTQRSLSEVEAGTLAMSRSLTNNLKETYDSLLANLKDLPTNLQTKLSQTCRDMGELHSCFVSAHRFGDLSGGFLNKSFEVMAEAQGSMDALMEYALDSPKALFWFKDQFPSSGTTQEQKPREDVPLEQEEAPSSSEREEGNILKIQQAYEPKGCNKETLFKEEEEEVLPSSKPESEDIFKILQAYDPKGCEEDLPSNRNEDEVETSGKEETKEEPKDYVPKLPSVEASSNQEEEEVPPPVEEEKEIPPPVEEEKEIPPPVQEEEEVPPPVEQEKEVPPPVEEEKEIPPPVEEEKELPAPVEEEKEIPPPAQVPTAPPSKEVMLNVRENDEPEDGGDEAPLVEESPEVPPEVEKEVNIPPTATEEENIPPPEMKEEEKIPPPVIKKEEEKTPPPVMTESILKLQRTYDPIGCKDGTEREEVSTSGHQEMVDIIKIQEAYDPQGCREAPPREEGAAAATMSEKQDWGILKVLQSYIPHVPHIEVFSSSKKGEVTPPPSRPVETERERERETERDRESDILKIQKAYDPMGCEDE